MFLRIFQHLLPNARSWRITINKKLRQFFEGLTTPLGSNIKTFLDGVWLDIFPETTREIPQWEQQFALPSTLTNEQERRDRLDAAWKALGGQSPRYIQDTLQAAGFDVYVHQWWVPGTEPPVGVDTPATARSPFTYLNDGILPLRYFSNDGGADMQDGDIAIAMDGATFQPPGYVLVNKIYIPSTSIIGDGSAIMNDGSADAMDGRLLTVYALKQYIIPSDVTKYPYFLYIGGATFPDHANVDASRKNEFETLCLKICPTQQWIGILVDYS